MNLTIEGVDVIKNTSNLCQLKCLNLSKVMSNNSWESTHSSCNQITKQI